MDNEAQRWKDIALYLASCHAATAEYDSTLKGVSNARKNRYRDICKVALDSIKAGWLVGKARQTDRLVIERLEAVVND